MTVKNFLAKKISFFDGNVRFDSIKFEPEIEAYKIFIDVNVSQKINSSFKIKATLSNNTDTNISTDIFGFDDTDAKRIMIFGNPFEKDDTLVNCISFEYSDYTLNSLVYFWLCVYEVDEGTREDLYPFSKTALKNIVTSKQPLFHLKNFKTIFMNFKDFKTNNYILPLGLMGVEVNENGILHKHTRAFKTDIQKKVFFYIHMVFKGFVDDIREDGGYVFATTNKNEELISVEVKNVSSELYERIKKKLPNFFEK